MFQFESHPTWVRGLKQSLMTLNVFYLTSHPTWVRGLKHGTMLCHSVVVKSHPTWVRGLKLFGVILGNSSMSRTLRGCVD